MNNSGKGAVMSKKTLRLWSVLLSVFLVVSMIPTMVFAGNEDPIEIIAQPENITAQIGEEATMSVVAENVASYQWQRSSDNGQNWFYEFELYKREDRHDDGQGQ